MAKKAQEGGAELSGRAAAGSGRAPGSFLYTTSLHGTSALRVAGGPRYSPAP